MIYKVWIQIEEIDESKDHYQNIGEPYTAGKFKTKKDASKFVENELLVTRAVNLKLLNACRAAIKFLNGLGKANLMTTLQKLKICRKRLKDAVNHNMPAVNDSCPECGAGPDLRRITGSTADLLQAAKVLTSYTTDLLYRLDDQVNIGDIEELQQAKGAIARYDFA